jgi:hypothetical protein
LCRAPMAETVAPPAETLPVAAQDALPAPAQAE